MPVPKKQKTRLEVLQGVAMLILDVDGTLTDGTLYLGESGDCFKRFSTRDGMAIRTLQAMGCRVGIISHSSQKEAIASRAAMLNITHCSVGGDVGKEEVMMSWSRELSIPLHRIAAMGDNLNDAAMLAACGLAICPSDAAFTIREQADIVLHSPGGDGCVGEWVNFYYLPARNWGAA